MADPKAAAGFDMASFAALLAGAISQRQNGLNPVPETIDRGETDGTSHVAVARGYASGVIVEPGEFVPAGVPVALEEDHPEGWMRVATKKDLKALETEDA